MRIYLRNMHKPKKILDSLFSSTKREILSALVLNPDKWCYLSDIAKRIKKTPSSLQRDLSSLNSSGILERKVEGKRVYFRPDPKCPILKELQGIFLKTSGLVDVLEKTLKGFDKEIQFAFVFGSIARGKELSGSDVDLMVIGDLGLAELAPKLKAAEKKLLREINPVIYSIKDFKRKIKEKDHFVTSIIKEEKLMLKGESEYLDAVN